MQLWRVISCQNNGILKLRGTQVPPMKLNEFRVYSRELAGHYACWRYTRNAGRDISKDIKEYWSCPGIKNIVSNLQRFRPPTGDPLDAEIQARQLQGNRTTKVIGIKSPCFYKKIMYVRNCKWKATGRGPGPQKDLKSMIAERYTRMGINYTTQPDVTLTQR